MLFIDHVMIRTADLEKSIEFYQCVLGMSVDNIDDHKDDDHNGKGYKLCFMKDENGMMIELTYNYGVDDNDSYQLGNTFDHIGFRTDHAFEILGKAKRLGYNVGQRNHKTQDGRLYIIGKIISPEGISIAVVEKRCEN